MGPSRAKASTNRSSSESSSTEQFADEFVVSRTPDDGSSIQGASELSQSQQQAPSSRPTATWSRLKDRMSSRAFLTASSRAFLTPPPKRIKSMVSSDDALSNLGEGDSMLFEEVNHESSNIVFEYDPNLPRGALLPTDSSDQDITMDMRETKKKSRSERSLQEWVAKVIATDNIDEIRRFDDEKHASVIPRKVRLRLLSCFAVIAIVAMVLVGVGASVGVSMYVSNARASSAGTNQTTTTSRQRPSTAPSNSEHEEHGDGIQATWSTLPSDWADGISPSPFHGRGHDFHQSVTMSDDGLMVASVVNSKLIFFIYEGVFWKEVAGPTLEGDIANVSFDGKGTRLAIACTSEKKTTDVQVLEFNGAEWTRVGQHIPFSLSPRVSIALSSDGTALVVGWTGDVSSLGSVVVMRYNKKSGWWLPEGDVLYGNAEWDLFGLSVSINHEGNVVAVGMPGKYANGNNGAGAARVYHFKEENWVQVGEDINGHHPDEQFGYSVSLSLEGVRLAVGNSYIVQTSYVFETSGGSWSQLGSAIELKQMGGSTITAVLSGNGDTLALGGANQCRLYGLEGKNWTLLGEFSGNTEGFGESVALNSQGGRVAIGAGHIDRDSYIRILQRRI